MITDLIVVGTVGFAAAFVAAWWLRPSLRVWIERPKHQFHDAVRGYDRAQHRDGPAEGSHSA